MDKNPHGYCHLDREAFALAKEYRYGSSDPLRERLTRQQYAVLVKGATEPPFSSEYVENDREGIYVDAATGEPLFASFDQYNSGCGWPSFTKPLTAEAVVEHPMMAFGHQRTEVRSNVGNFHLGHVFNDGPPERGGLRYCINGAALKFIAREDLVKEGYDYLLPYLEKRAKEE